MDCNGNTMVELDENGNCCRRESRMDEGVMLQCVHPTSDASSHFRHPTPA